MNCINDRTTPHKQGLTWTLTGYLLDANSEKIPLGNLTIQSKIVDQKAAVVSVCDVSLVDDYHYKLSVLNTNAWPIGTLYTDIKFIAQDGTSAATETLLIQNAYSPTQ